MITILYKGYNEQLDEEVHRAGSRRDNCDNYPQITKHIV